MRVLPHPAWLLALALLQAELAPGATYQVGPTRTYTNLQAVTGLLNPGDIVEVDGNASYPGGVVFSRPGTAAQKITIRGLRVAGNRPILSGATNTVTFSTPSIASPANAANHYVFEGFEVTGGTFRCIYHQADDLVVRDVVVHDCAAHGILGADQGSGSAVLDRVEVYRCGNGTGQHQIYMATDEVNRPGSVFRMQHCYLHDAIGGNNVKSRAERNEIYFNWIEGALYHELELIGPDPGGAPAGWSEGLVREDSDVVGNVLIKRVTFSVVRFGGDATGQSWGRYRFVNNTVLAAGTSAVFRLFDGLESVDMHNNVFLKADGTALNVVRQVEAVWASGEQISGSANWVRSGSTNIPGTWTGTLTGTDPGLVNIAGNDLTPTAASPLRGAANPTPSTPVAFPFPTPYFPPEYEPPPHTLAAAPTPRAFDCDLDIGARERPPASATIWGLRFSSPTTLTWLPAPGATGYDTFKGDLSLLRSTGSFGVSVTACLENHGADLVSTDAATPSTGQAFYYLVRAVPGGTADTLCPSQASPRDADLQTSPVACP